MAKKMNSLNLVKLNEAINLVNQNVNLLGIVIERSRPNQCRNKAWLCTLRIIDDSYGSPGVTVNVFSNKFEELPHIENLHKDMILFTRVEMKSFGGKGVNGACNIRFSSFALYKEGIGEDFVCYKRTCNFHEEAQYKSAIDDLGKLFANNSRVDEALQSASYRIKAAQNVGNFSFLREIKEGKSFDLVCKILHVNEDRSAVFVWDGTDAPPASIPMKRIEEDKPFSSISVRTLLSRDILRRFPTTGTILRVSLSNHLSHWIKPGEWVKLYNLLCQVDRGCWIGKATDSTKIHHARNEPLVEKIKRIYDKRNSSKFGCTPYWSFPSPPGLTETDHDGEPIVTLMDIITYPEVTYKYRCIVRVVDAYPWQVEDIYSNENHRCRVLLTLEDPTATLDVFLCDKDAEYFWGLGFQNTETLKKKLNLLLGISDSSDPKNPPWIDCCIASYHTDEADPWNNRFYSIFGTRLLDLNSQ